MPLNNYVKVSIGEQTVSYTKGDDIPVAINYQLEDLDNFQIKKAGTSFGITVPATLNNDQVANTFHNPAVEDLTSGEVFKNYQKAKIESNGSELLVGKAVLDEATHTDKPESYKFDLYGDNADWALELSETTLYDILKDKTIEFTQERVENSWGYDGTDENIWYVFAPVKYREPFADNDTNIKLEYLRPSISCYFLLYWAFKSIGYKINSEFFDTEYFRRAVLPWTWGSFLDVTAAKVHEFRALRPFSTGDPGVHTNGGFSGVIDTPLSDTYTGAYNNNNDYSYDTGTKQHVWHYNTRHFGPLIAEFKLIFDWELWIGANKNVKVDMVWELNGGALLTRTLFNNTAPLLIHETDAKTGVEVIERFTLNNGDDLRLKIVLNQTTGWAGGDTDSRIYFQELKLTSLMAPIGGTIFFDSFSVFQKSKFLDFFRGVCDDFNLSFNTDATKKEIVIEPTHPYSLTNDLSVKSGGYFNEDYLDWNDKQDISKVSTVSLYRDYARELVFKFKNDAQDGMLKVIQDRNHSIIGASKFLFPERFAKEKKEFENRFFAPVMHADMNMFKPITGVAPQMIVIIPENRANTSESEAESTLLPKLAYYKGVVDAVGGWTFEGVDKNDFPFMFAVNYKSGGESDPILSYCDEIFPGGIIGKGLVKRFYWQRLAIMRNGQWYETNFHLNNNDVQNIYHREHKMCRGQRWELIRINGYRPLMEETTKCNLRKWSPISNYERFNTFPSSNMLLAYPLQSADYEFDIPYIPSKCLSSDLYL